MMGSFIRRSLLAALACMLSGAGTHVKAQVSQLTVSPARLVNGDGKPKNVTLTAALPSSASIHVAVDFRPSVGSSATQYIQSYEVRDNDGRDGDQRGGVIRTTLTRSFSDVGIYHIRVAEWRTVMTVVHEPAPSWWSSLVDQLFGASGDGTRSSEEVDDSVAARLDARPVLSSIRVARVPVAGHEIETVDLAVKIQAAVTPAWSRISTLLACAAWRQNRWRIAAYDFSAAGAVSEKWVWPSADSAGDFSPAWSPDERNVAFVRRASDNKTDIWLLYLDAQGKPVREARLTNLSNVRQLIAWDSKLGLFFEVESVVGTGARVREIWSMPVSPDGQQPAGAAVSRPDPYRFLRGRLAGRDSVILDVQSDSPPRSEIKEKRAGRADSTLLIGGECTYWWPAVSGNGKWLALESDCPVR